MMRFSFLASCALIGLSNSVLCAEESTESVEPGVSYSQEIQPILAKHCLLCHGPDEAESGLRLDLAERAYAELESGVRAIVPGEIAASELLHRVSTDDEFLRMPPEGDRLDAEQIELLRRWIAQGAPFEQHWSYLPIQNPEPPQVANEEWVRNPIDRFVLAGLEGNGIAPSAEAERATLIKRLYYDLIGLPPTPEEVDAFVQDSSPNAYELLVDRLLNSAHFGERWGRHWLDRARYADSDGYEKDNPRPNAWKYRDWVIDAINRDVPYDQFTIEQLAGDLLPEASPMQKLATAFHRQTLTNTEGGTDQEEFRVEATFDRTETTGAIWMGLTLTCARCHTHKYDQISQHEYYQLFAFFNSANEANSEVLRSEDDLERYEREKEGFDAEVAALEQQYAAAQREHQPMIDAWDRQMREKLAEATNPPSFHEITLVEAKAASGAELAVQEEGSLLASGPTSDKDRYTLVFEAPTSPLTGLRLETLIHDSLVNKGPGRAPNGNFVLSELHVAVGDDPEFKQSRPIEFATAEADYSQGNFPPENALSSEERTGWAVGPQMGKNHTITFFTDEPVQFEGQKYLQIVLDQQYGGSHTIGHFRLTAMSGFDPLRALPKTVAEAVKTAPEKRTEEQQRVIVDHVLSLDPETAKIGERLTELKKNPPASPMMTVRVMAPAQRQTRVLHRGDFLQPADEVPSGALDVITQTHPLTSRHAEQSPDRLDLAHWLMDPNHPLTPRVTVNQVWAHLFGRGLVATLNDFGVRGEQPSHPELLDWLAYHFPRDMGWSRKTLIRTIVTSATYRQSSAHRPELTEIDPINRLLARQNRVRVEAEIVRDLHLSVAGLLSTKIGGPSVFPPLPPGVAELSYANNFRWNTSEGEDRFRRGMYTFFKRTAPHPTLISFDCPDSNTSQLQRNVSNTPLQALVTLNNEVFTEAAQGMARRVLTEGGDDDIQRLTYALRLCIARTPESSEFNRFQELLNAAREYYQAHPDDAAKVVSRHSVSELPAAENAAWVVTVRMMTNLDEFIVRE